MQSVAIRLAGRRLRLSQPADGRSARHDPHHRTTGDPIGAIPPAPHRSTGAADQTRDVGTLKNCIAYGPGILDLAHQPDEWIGVQDMVDSATVMALTLAELLLPGR